jgi:hypothetical protein
MPENLKNILHKIKKKTAKKTSTATNQLTVVFFHLLRPRPPPVLHGQNVDSSSLTPAFRRISRGSSLGS